MSQIHITDPSGRQSALTEEEARSRWAGGLIPRQSLYWREGMPAWRPAVEFFEGVSPMIPKPPEMPAHPPRTFARDPSKLTRILIGFLWAFIVSAVLSAALSGATIAQGANTFESEELTPFDLVLLFHASSYIGIYIATAVVFLRWIHRAHLNAIGLGATGKRFSPGWAVGWFFIPIANLWKPYQAMKELWQTSSKPEAWESESVPALLGGWWVLWLLSNVLGQASARLAFREGSGQELAVASEVLSLISSLVDIPLSLVAMRIVKTIHAMQRRHVDGDTQPG